MRANRMPGRKKLPIDIPPSQRRMTDFTLENKLGDAKDAVEASSEGTNNNNAHL